MISTLVILVTTPAITYEEMEAKMHEAYRALTDYREVMAITITAAGQNQLLRIERLISGSRNRLKITVDGVDISDTGYDGMTAHAVLHPERLYQLRQGKNEEFETKYKPVDLSKEEDGYFNFVPQSVYGVRFEVKPPPKVISEETVKLDGVDLRKIVAESPKIAENDLLRMTFFFYVDKWIIKQFEVEARSRSGKAMQIKGIATEANFNAGLTQREFVFDVATVPGYRKVGG